MNAHITIEHDECLPRINKIERNFMAHAVTRDEDAPLVKRGDYVVADTSDTMPVDGGMFLVEWSNGRRAVMKTRPRACEFFERDGVPSIFMRGDGPDTVWYFHCAVRSMSRLCDGPYRLEQMQSKILGKVVGVAVGEAATEWAEHQVGEHDRVVDQRARKAAEGFDPDLWIDLRDRTGQVSALMVRPNGNGILAVMVDHDGVEADRIYKKYDAVFRAEVEGCTHSRAKLVAALRKAGRVVTLKDGRWCPDPKMPAHVLAAHFPGVVGVAA